MLDILRKEKFYGNMKKCSFGMDQVVFLGYVVSSKEVLMDENKVKTIVDWPTPSSVHEVRVSMVLLPSIEGLLVISVPLQLLSPIVSRKSPLFGLMKPKKASNF